MPDPFVPGCPYDPGNAGIARKIAVQTVTLHRTIGSWPGDYSVGKNRSHNDGTFQFLIGQDVGQWVQFFPLDRFASHAAGANEVGSGIEISGQNGEPLTDWQVEALGQILRWLRDEWGIAPTFTDGDPRVYADQAGPLGFITHRHVDYPPDRRYLHNDYITEDEFNRALGADVPLTEQEWDRLNLIVLGHAREVAGAANVDGSLPTLAQVVGDVAALRAKVDALTGTSSATVALLPSDLDAIADKVADKLAARLKD